MAKQLNINLSFNADAEKAKAQIQQLQTQLDSLTKSTAQQLPITKEIQEAQQATVQLKTALTQAVNVNTGKFDLSKFNKSIKDSGTSLEQIRNRLVQLGPTGQQAFLSLAQSITTAEIPARRTNALLTQLGTTLKNTVKWQFSSSMLHSFMGAIQGAYRYAQDLNSSLNDIRIVTGYGADEMDRFAVKANKAAKALSTSTLEYTNASLIYYQQGLSNEEVEQRTNVTVKMANVTGESAKDVSDYMTAIWNNFDNGSKSLEYYADVMTALGAATASSTDEIAAGLEKFAAVAETVGLSYEMATSALATVTATTRQSADVVGTAFKTLFARIQDLELGETLEDGTTLGSYSEALLKVGVNIKDANGQLKDMDVILKEMAVKWQDLEKDEKTALAQSVAGVRQYTQLIALMDNWDFMEENLSVAENATGTLQDQADIYAESWEAASDRVKASAEAIYSDLLNDDFFISMLNGLEKVLTLFDSFLDSIGGAKGLLFGLSSILLNTFSGQAAKGLENMVYNLKSFIGLTQQEAIATQKKAASLASSIGAGSVLDSNQTTATTMGMQSQLELSQQLSQMTEQMTEDQKLSAQAIINQNSAYAEQLVLLGQKADLAKTEQQTARKDILDDAAFEMSTDAAVEALEKIDADIMDGESIIAEVEKIEASFKDGTLTIEEYKKAMADLQTQAKEKGLDSTAKVLSKVSGRNADSAKKLNMTEMTQAATTKDIKTKARKAITSKSVEDKDIDNYIKKTRKAIGTDKEFSDGKKALNKNTKDSAQAMKQLTNTTQQVSQTIVKASQAVMSLSFGINAISQLGDIWSDETLSGGEKLLQTLMSLGTAIPMLVNGFNGMNSVLGITSALEAKQALSVQFYLAAQSKKLASLNAEGQAELANNLSKATGISLDTAKAQVSNAVAAAKMKEAYASGAITSATTAETLAKTYGITMDQAEVISSKLAAGATMEEALAESGLTKMKLGGIAGAITNIYTKGLETGARWANVVAMIAEQTAMSPLLIMTLALVAAMVALAAIIAVVVTAVNAIINAYNADAIAAEKAEQAAKDLAKTYEETKQAYEDMIAAMENYENAQKSLEELTKGTDEYKAALQEANRAALELINNYPHLFKAGDYAWKDGQLIINEDAMANAKAQGAEMEAQSYAAMQMGNAEAKDARNRADETELRRKMAGETSTAGHDIIGAAVGTAVLSKITTAVAALIPGIGPAIAPVVGKAAGAAIGVAATKAFEGKQLKDSDAINKMAKLYQEDKNAFELDDEVLKEKLQIDDDAIIDALKNNKDAIIELSNNIEAQNEFEKIAAQESAAEIIESSQYANSKYADDMVNVAANKFQETQTKKYDELLDLMSSKGGLKAGANSYFDQMGISSKTGFEVGKYDAKKGTVSYSYLDEEGERQEKEVTAMQISQYLAVAEAQNSVISACDILSNTFKKLDTDSSALGEGMKKFLSTGDSTQLTKDQYDEISGMSNDELLAYLNNLGINDNNVGDLGYDDMADFINSMDLEKTGAEWDNYKDITAVAGSENLTLEGAENIQTALKGITDFFGQEVSDEILKMSGTMADSLDEATQAEFWKQLGQINDYTDAEAWEGLIDAMKESGNLTEDQSKALENYVDAAKLAANATKELNFDELAESVGKLRDVMENIADGSREISDEDYAALEENGIDTSKFAKTIDGYRYLGDSADIITDISKGITEKFKEAEANFANIAANAAQASQNLIDAEAALEKARIAGDKARASAEQGASNQLSNTEKLSVVMSRIVDIVVSKIQAAWEWISGIMIKIYDFFASIFNTIGQGITDAWNWLLGTIENIINSVAGAIVEILEKIPGVDVDWEEVAFDKATFEGVKTTDEIEAEEAAKKAEEDLIASTQALADAIPEMVNSIESSADYLSEAELQSKQDEAEANYNDATAQYKDAVATYGEDSSQAQYYEQLVAYYEAQMGAYEKALKSKAWGEVIAEGIDTGEMEAYMDLIEEANPQMKDLYESTEEYEQALLAVATANKKMEKGVKSLSSNWEDWDDIMTDSSSTAEDISTILPDVNDALQDVLNLDTTEFALLPPDFAQKNWGLIQDVVNGVEGAVDKLRNKAGEEILLNVGAKVDADGDGSVDAAFMEIHNKIAEYDQEQFTVGVAIDPAQHAEFFAACNELINAAGMTADQAQAYFASMGYDVELEEVEAPPKETPWHIDNPKLDEEATKAAGVPIFSGTETLTGTNKSGGGTALAVKTITPTGSYGGGVGVNTTAPKTSQPSSSSSGGGSNKKTSDSRKTKDDMVERYKEINDKLDDQEKSLDRASKAADRLWGSARIKQMREVGKELQKEIGLLKDKKAQVDADLKTDRTELNSAAADLGLSFSYDDDNISNYTEQMTQLWKDREALLDSFGSEMDEDEQEILDEFDTKIERLETAISQYDETRELSEDLDDEIEDKFYEWQDNNAEILTYTLEMNLEINERELTKLDYYLSKVEDDVYQAAEAASLMVGELSSGGDLIIGGQLGAYLGNLSEYQKNLAALEASYANGEISQEAYAEGLQTIHDGLYDNLSSIQELDKAMLSYYGDTLALVGEEIAKYTDRMAHQTKVLQHYQSLMELMGKSTDYKSMGKILEGQSKTLKNEMDASKKEWEMYQQEAEKKKKLYEDAVAAGNAAEAEMYKKQYEDALAASDEAQEAYLSKAEEYAESLKAVLENKLAGLAKDLEKALTGGSSFEQITTQLERAASLQEEYLTTTNKIYETNKMINTAQQEIDKTSNTIAKNRLKQFINETAEMQNQSKLSKFELEIQQAKYDLLLAEIALEEAQDAKSTVRLQRDSEGNFGYIYTADESQIADAEQKLADQQNKLYNIQLEGANGYTEKYIETLNEMYDTLADLQQQYLNEAFETEEEYHRAVEDAKSYYYEKLEQYSDLHAIAIETDTRVIQDAWSTQFNTMISSSQRWKINVENYVKDVSKAFKNWKTDLEKLKIETGLGNIETAVGKITTASDALHVALVGEDGDGGVINDLKTQLDLVSQTTKAWGKQRGTILDLIGDYEDLASAVQIVLDKMAKDDEEDDEDQVCPKCKKKGCKGDCSKNPDGTGDGSGLSVTDSQTKRGVALAIWNGNYGWGNNPGRSTKLKEKGFDPSEIQALVNNTDPSAGWGTRYGITDLSKYAYSKFDTGGYTGNWGPDGKWAMLHEKELVLNKDDTSNFLMSIELLNHIIDMIDLQSANAQMSNIMSNTNYIPHMSETQSIEQSVHIEASFPGVSERTEIEEAFNNLINQASQYANRQSVINK